MHSHRMSLHHRGRVHSNMANQYRHPDNFPLNMINMRPNRIHHCGRSTPIWPNVIATSTTALSTCAHTESPYTIVIRFVPGFVPTRPTCNAITSRISPTINCLSLPNDTSHGQAGQRLTDVLQMARPSFSELSQNFRRERPQGNCTQTQQAR